MVYVATLVMALFLAACNSGGGGSSAENFGPTSPVSGTLTYDYVPITSSGLNYAGTSQKPVRNVYIEARRTRDNKKLSSSYTDDNGAFVIDVPESVSEFYIGVFSLLKSPNFRIVDNTNGAALYLAASSNIQNTLGGMTLPNINLQSGWTGSSYGATRAAAPFALLDSIYSAVLKIHEERPAVNFPDLVINWSKNNLSSLNYNPASGEIGTSHYNPDNNQLYILGKENSDTDEYDRHIVVHEFGHYIEDRLGRSDSLGGAHSEGDLLAMSLAFGEGWGNALSAMVFDPAVTYLDSSSSQQSTISVNMNVESGSDTSKGWYSEVSVQQLLFDVYDGTGESGDNIELGIGPVMDVMLNDQKTTPALTSIFSFMTALKTRNPTEVTNIDTLVNTKNMQPVQDAYGTGETNSGGMSMAIPVYNSLVLDGASVATRIAGYAYRYNEAQNTRYYKFTAGSAKTRLVWTSSDTFYLFVLNKGNIVLEGGSESQGSTISGSQDLNTASGQEYVVQLLTIPEKVKLPNPINFNLSVQKR